MDKYAEIRRKAVPILKPYINRLAVFGSTVRGEATTKSDIDLLIRLKPSSERPKLGLFKLLEIEEDLQKKLGREVDLVTEDSLSPYIRPYVDQEKVIIYEER
ncbi:MAG TPA: nucleotidyltransferase family protein [Anaerolineales bacterium]|nr:nucleotidyltransferase family protein [Anaerolineales bacterium]